MIAFVALSLAVATLQPRTTPQTDGEHAQCLAAAEVIVAATAAVPQANEPAFVAVREYAAAVAETYAERVAGPDGEAFLERKRQAQAPMMDGTVQQAWDLVVSCSSDLNPPPIPA